MLRTIIQFPALECETKSPSEVFELFELRAEFSYDDLEIANDNPLEFKEAVERKT